MVDENKTVKIKIGTLNRKHFSSLGYICPALGDEMDVYIKDLSPTSKIKIPCTCDYCGKEYSVVSEMHNRAMRHPDIQKDACSDCAGLKNSEVRLIREKQKMFPKLQEICEQLGYTLITKPEEYTGAKMNVRIICPKHGEKEMLLANLLRGHICIDCSYEIRGDGLKKSISEIVEDIEAVNNNKLLNPQDYTTVNTPNLLILCGCCGKNSFRVSYSNYIRRGVNKCRTCSAKISNGELLIKQYLDSCNIKYEAEKRFCDCRDKKPLPFDFYLNDFNVLIEFDGEQHYYEVFGKSSFEKTKKHDRMKNDYCKINGIPLLRIPYWEKNNIDKLISNFIDNIGKRYDLISCESMSGLTGAA